MISDNNANRIMVSTVDSLRKVNLKTKTLIQGTVIAISSDQVILETAFKSEAFIPRAQFKEDEQALQVGATFELWVLQVDNSRGEGIFSRVKARSVDFINTLQHALKDNSTLTCVVTKEIAHGANREIKSGYLISYKGITGFLPFSLSGVAFADESAQADLINQPLEVKIINIDLAKNNFVASRKAYLYEQGAQQRLATLQSIKEGDVITAKVSSLVVFGAFVEFGGVDALVHISEIAYQRIKHPSQVLTVGQQITAKIKSIESGKTRSYIYLSIKECSVDPIEEFCKQYQENDIVTGTVTKTVEYGCFVSLGVGVDGLIPNNYIDWSSKPTVASKYFTPGDVVKCQILKICRSSREISLNYRACQKSFWSDFVEQNQVGDVITGTITTLNHFGIFALVHRGIEGLIYLGELAKHAEVVDNYRVGDQIELLIDRINERKTQVALNLLKPSAKLYELIYRKANLVLNNEYTVTISDTTKNEQYKGYPVTYNNYLKGFLQTDVQHELKSLVQSTLIGTPGNLLLFTKVVESKQTVKPTYNKTTLGSLIKDQFSK
jgi:small subunit ribosomal protein S1